MIWNALTTCNFNSTEAHAQTTPEYVCFGMPLSDLSSALCCVAADQSGLTLQHRDQELLVSLMCIRAISTRPDATQGGELRHLAARLLSRATSLNAAASRLRSSQ